MLELRILNGLHQGASLMLDEERIVLGASLEADIEIIDPGIKESHCVIEYSVDKNTWYAKALEGDITLECENERTSAVEVRQNLVIKIAGIYLGFFDADEPWDIEKYSRPEIIQPEKISRTFPFSQYKVHLGLFAVTGSLLTYSLASAGSNAKEDKLDLTPHSTAQHELNTIMQTSSELDIDVVSEIKHMLRQRGLQKKVQLTGNDNQWVISGSLTKDDLDTVSRMVERFKATYPSVQLLDSTSPPANALPFEIRSVSSGLYAHILTTEGQRIYIGDKIAGFTLKKIEKDKLLFSGESDVELIW